MTMVQGQAAVEAATLSITAGATSQVLFAANGARKYMIFSNTSDTIMYLRFHDSSAAVSLIGVAVAAGATYQTPSVCPTSRISVICATIAKTFYAIEG